jgi:hypothetical protein
MATKVIQRIPLPWAVSITVVISLPFGLFLGKYNFPLWVAFSVWAEYFVFGAQVSSWKLVFPSIPAGAAAAALWMGTSALLGNLIPNQFIALSVGNLIWVTILLYAIPKLKAWSDGTLAVFNGLTLFLAVYFTNSIPQIGVANPYLVILLAFVWTTLMAYFGWVLGWLNITLTFPKVVKEGEEKAKAYA